MEKILLVVGHNGIDRSALDFACFLADLTTSRLTGLFIDPEVVQAKTNDKVYSGDAIPENEVEEISRKNQLGENKRAFALACSNKSIRWEDDHKAISNVEDIIIESRFADVLIIAGECTLNQYSETSPTQFVKDILSRSECPVIVAPLQFNGAEEIILAYDASPSAVYAMKQFTYLFPQLSETRIIFLQINPTESSEITHHEKIGDYLKMHYSAIGFHVLHGNKAEDELFGYLLSKKNAFVVTGAYGRSMISSFFKRSTAELLLKTTCLPVFIAHR